MIKPDHHSVRAWCMTTGLPGTLTERQVELAVKEDAPFDAICKDPLTGEWIECGSIYFLHAEELYTEYRNQLKCEAIEKGLESAKT